MGGENELAKRFCIKQNLSYLINFSNMHSPKIIALSVRDKCKESLHLIKAIQTAIEGHVLLEG